MSSDEPQRRDDTDDESQAQHGRRTVLASGASGLFGMLAAKGEGTGGRRATDGGRQRSVAGAPTAQSNGPQQPTSGAENVVDHGAALDGETDDTEALRAAFEAAGPSGGVYVPPGGALRTTEAVVFSLDGAQGFNLFCHSPIAPDPGIGDALTIQKGNPKHVDFYVQGGGRDADYTKPDPEGADQALVLRLVRGGSYRVLGAGYKGRVLRVNDEQTTDAYKTSKLRINQLETRWYGGEFCGQAFYVDAESAIGKLGLVHSFWDAYGPVVDGGFDFGIRHLAGGWNGASGLEIRGHGNMTIDTIAVGNESFNIPLLTLVDSTGIHVKRAFLLRARAGAVVENCRNVTFGNLYTNNNERGGLIVRDSTDLQITQKSLRDGVAQSFRGTSQVTTQLHTDADESGEAAVRIDGGRDYRVSGSVYAPIEVSGGARRVLLDHVRAPTLSVEADNDVRVSGGWIGFYDGTPHKINNHGRERAAAETPSDRSWDVGDLVAFTDTEDGTGDGLYLRSADGEWVRLQTGAPAERGTTAADGGTETATTTRTTEAETRTEARTESETTGTETASSGGVSGFGIGAGVLSLLGAGALAARDDE